MSLSRATYYLVFHDAIFIHYVEFFHFAQSSDCACDHMKAARNTILVLHKSHKVITDSLLVTNKACDVQDSDSGVGQAVHASTGGTISVVVC